MERGPKGRRPKGALWQRLIASGLILLGLVGALFLTFASTTAATWDPTTGAVEISASPTSAALSFSGMAPGDSVTRPLTVSNDGSLPLRYAVTSKTSDETLAAQLEMTIKTNVTDCNDEGFDRDGDAVHGPGDLGSIGGLDVVGNPSLGPDPGDRALEAFASEMLCIRVSLPLSAGNAYQGLSTVSTLSFIAEQIP
ncbi:MAG: TasA family protein [Chloroflexi bacterium]|nr:TasA family protein [Chloroflexota bacterium]